MHVGYFPGDPQPPMTRLLDRLVKRARRQFCNEIWNVGFIEQPADDIVSQGITGPVRWLPRLPRATILADPSWRARPDGGSTWFAEFMDYRQPRGEIWSAEIEPNGNPAAAQFQQAIVEPFHMSYPTPFVSDLGASRLTAEIWPADDTFIWTEHDGKWRRAGILFPGRPAVDPTLWRTKGYWWLFCTFRIEGPNDRLFLFHAKNLDGPWTPHKHNPVKVDAGSARPAGPIFRAGDKLIRPAQDCTQTYGGAVVLHEITRLDEEAFEERPVRRLDPIPGRYSAGLHTFCPAGDVTLIDGKTWQLDTIRIPRKLREIVGW